MGRYDVGHPLTESAHDFISRARQNLWDITEPYQGKYSEYATRIHSMRDLCEKIIEILEHDYVIAVEAGNAALQKQLDMERDRVKHLERQIQDEERKKKGLDEIWNDDLSNRKVAFTGRPTNDKNYGAVFNLGQLEELAYRARLGGGVDETDIVFSFSKAEATLIAPENVVDLSPRDDFDYTKKDVEKRSPDGVSKDRMNFSVDKHMVMLLSMIATICLVVAGVVKVFS